MYLIFPPINHIITNVAVFGVCLGKKEREVVENYGNMPVGESLSQGW